MAPQNNRLILSPYVCSIHCEFSPIEELNITHMVFPEHTQKGATISFGTIGKSWTSGSS